MTQHQFGSRKKASKEKTSSGVPDLLVLQLWVGLRCLITNSVGRMCGPGWRSEAESITVTEG